MRIAVAIFVVCGVPLLIFGAAVYDLLSPREVAGGMLAWFAGILIWAAVGQFLTYKSLASPKEPVVPLDDRTRRRILRRVKTYKIWFGVLVVCLPLGIANGVAQRAWLPTIGGDQPILDVRNFTNDSGFAKAPRP